MYYKKVSWSANVHFEGEIYSHISMKILRYFSKNITIEKANIIYWRSMTIVVKFSLPKAHNTFPLWTNTYFVSL